MIMYINYFSAVIIAYTKAVVANGGFEKATNVALELIRRMRAAERCFSMFALRPIFAHQSAGDAGA